MSRSGFPILAQRVRVEDSIDRSRFVTTAIAVCSLVAAREFVAQVAAEFPGATHHCFAFSIGPPGSLENVGMSDDGEPHGTAGRPMLDVLLGSGLGDVAVVVSRWFGGTKLGKGGLVRAYGGCVQHALATGVRATKMDWAHATLRFGYELHRNIDHLHGRFGAEVLSSEFADQVTQRVRAPRESFAMLIDHWRDAARGRIEIVCDEGPRPS